MLCTALCTGRQNIIQAEGLGLGFSAASKTTARLKHGVRADLCGFYLVECYIHVYSCIEWQSQ